MPGGLRTPRALLLPLLVLLLSAGAARAAEVEGGILFAPRLALEGDATLTAHEGALDLAPQGQAPRGARLAFASAEGYVVTQELEYVGVPGIAEQYRGTSAPRNETVTLEPGAFSNFTCGEGCTILLYGDGRGGTLAMEGRAHGPLGVLAERRAYATGGEMRPARDAFLYAAEPGWTAVETNSLDAARAHATGDLSLYVTNATLEWRGEAGSQTWSTRTEVEPVEGPAGASFARKQTFRFLVLRLTDAELSLPAGAAATLLAPEPALELRGVVSAPQARGTLHVEGRRIDLADEALEIEGRLHARLQSRPGLTAPLDASAPTHATLGGDATRIHVAGRALDLSPAPSAGATAAVVTGLSLAGLLALVLVTKLGGLPFYMRIHEDALLRNENRRRIHDTVRAHPGISVAETVRATGLRQIVVRHHVRMLEAHGLLVVRGSAKVRGLFILDGAVAPDAMPAHVLIKDPTRRLIATLLAEAEAPRSQEELARAAEKSRRLVCHHLRRLEESGLIASVEGSPRGYVATPRLREMLARPERRAPAA